MCSSSGIARRVSVSDLYIPRIGPHISCSRIGRSISGIYKMLMNAEIRTLARNSFSGNLYFEFLVFALCSVYIDAARYFIVVAH
jgi:hypothetical protein